MSRPNTATLLLRCPDQKGLNAAIANLLVRHNINILDAQQHTDEEAGIFFHRVYFDGGEVGHVSWELVVRS